MGPRYGSSFLRPDTVRGPHGRGGCLVFTKKDPADRRGSGRRAARVHARGDLRGEWEDLNSENGDGTGSVRENMGFKFGLKKTLHV